MYKMRCVPTGNQSFGHPDHILLLAKLSQHDIGGIEGSKDFLGYLPFRLPLVSNVIRNLSNTRSLDHRRSLRIEEALAKAVPVQPSGDIPKAAADCAINIEPTAEDLADIALSSAQTATDFGIDSRVAMISYATGQSNTGPIIDKVRKATALAKERQASLRIEGPLQFDAAIHPEVAAIKCKGQNVEVAGRATVCIFPDLNTGNTTYKAVQQATKCLAIGPIAQGLRRPVNDLPPDCSVRDIVNTVLITCVQAQVSKDKRLAGSSEASQPCESNAR